jgi:hypothetical protein
MELSSNKYDITIFEKKRIEQICFSENTISIHFQDNLSITILGSFVYIQDSNSAGIAQSPPITSSNLMSINGKEVCEVERNKEGSLKLFFDNGHSIEMIKDSLEYESFIIRTEHDEIIV